MSNNPPPPPTVPYRDTIASRPYLHTGSSDSYTAIPKPLAQVRFCSCKYLCRSSYRPIFGGHLNGLHHSSTCQPVDDTHKVMNVALRHLLQQPSVCYNGLPLCVGSHIRYRCWTPWFVFQLLYF
jgi:hypothetical protein